MRRFKKYFLRQDEADAGGGSGGTDFTETTKAAGTDSWYSGLPSDLQTDSIKSFKDPAGLAKSYVHLESMLGGEKIPKLSENATPEQKAFFYKAFGRPDKADGYGLGEDFKDFAPVMHEAGLNVQQAKALTEKYKSFVEGKNTEAAAVRDAQKAKGMQGLKDLWGDKYDDELATAGRALSTYVKDPKQLESIKEKLRESGLGNDAEFISLFNLIGKQSAEDVSRSSGALKTAAATDKQSANAEIKRLQSDPEFLKVMMDSDAPGFKEANLKLNRLYDQAYGGEDMSDYSPEVADGHKAIMGLV